MINEKFKRFGEFNEKVKGELSAQTERINDTSKAVDVKVKRNK